MKKRKPAVQARIFWLNVKIWYYQRRYGKLTVRQVQPLKELATIYYGLGEVEEGLKCRQRLVPVCSRCNQPCAAHSAMMQRLSLGTKEFRVKVYNPQEETFKKLTQGQRPHTLFISCADSRVDPTGLVQARLGELFVLRNAGNIVVPHSQGNEIGEGATIEYAVDGLKPGVNLIVVCGHTPCGAMKALLAAAKPQDLPTVSAWLKHAEDALDGLDESSDEDKLLAVTRRNVILQIEHLKTHPSVARAIAEGRIELHGWVYRMELGHVEDYSLTTKAWSVISDKETIEYCQEGLAADGHDHEHGEAGDKHDGCSHKE